MGPRATSAVTTPVLHSQKAEELSKVWFTLATPTFNRRHELNRLYESIKRIAEATRPEIVYEWVIVDDGSADNTAEEVELWCKENLFPIRYFYQPNQGKHVADNLAATVAKGEMMLTIDSDDELLPDTLNIFFDTWHSIPEDIRSGLKGVTCRCIDPDTGKIVGTPLPKSQNDGRFLIASPQDMRHKYRVKGEMCGFNRTELLRRYPCQVKKDAGKFMPESILWYTIGEKYPEYIIDTPVRIYHHDGNGAITAGDSRRRAPQNYYLWQYQVNNNLHKYLFRDPVNMLKAVVGMSRDGLITGRSMRRILADCKTPLSKALVLVFAPAGWLLKSI